MRGLPTGTVTFFLTDIEGSTRHWEEHPQVMQAALERHDAIAIGVIREHGGALVKNRGEGDSLFAVFERATDAVAAAAALQHAMHAEEWPTLTPLRVRVALHTGETDLRDGDYFGPAVNRCARLRSAARGGQVLLSGATQTVCAVLPPGAALRDLGLHSLRDLSQPERIYELWHPDLPAVEAPLRSLHALSHNLPPQNTTFVGREKEIDDVKRLLCAARLLTLTGSGGTGKTRLALEVAVQVLESYDDGVWLIELASLSDPELVPRAAATVLGVQEAPAISLTHTVTRYLKHKHMLLVLDNCEHLIGACATLAESLRSECPKVRLLATSREGLGLAGEQTYRVPSLGLPDLGRLPGPESLSRFESVKLFVDRARLGQPAFSVTSQNATALAQICCRLDGIPLAIELAAARVETLSPEKLAERLDDRFRLLTGGSRSAIPRQQTLRALIDWSYDLLSEPERILLRRLSVFAGGWTLEAAEAVCSDGAEILAPDIVDVLGALIDKSLVIYDAEGDRYRLLETVRQYARDRLFESGAADRIRTRHRDHYVLLAGAAQAAPMHAPPADVIERLDREDDNLRLALEWCGGPDGLEPGLRLVGSLWRYWEIRGYVTEATAWIEELLERDRAAGEPCPRSVRAHALSAAGTMAWCRSEFEKSRGYHELALREFQEAENLAQVAFSLNNLGVMAQLRGDFAAAAAFYESSLSVCRQIGDRSGSATPILNIGHIHRDVSEFERAAESYTECLDIARESGDDRCAAMALCGLGNLALATGDLETASGRYAEARGLALTLGDRRMAAVLLGNLGELAVSEARLLDACPMLSDALTTLSDVGDREGIAEVLTTVAAAALRAGPSFDAAGQEDAADRAARLLGAAEALREKIGITLPRDAHRRLAATLDEIRSLADDDEVARAWALGRAMTVEQTVVYAIETLGVLAAGVEELHLSGDTAAAGS